MQYHRYPHVAPQHAVPALNVEHLLPSEHGDGGGDVSDVPDTQADDKRFSDAGLGREIEDGELEEGEEEEDVAKE